MPTYPLRITFVTPEAAYRRFGQFPPPDLDYVDGWSRKRDGASQVVLLRVAGATELERFVALCRADSEVVEVARIQEEEFLQAPSNAI
jgi:hypothetical protein